MLERSKGRGQTNLEHLSSRQRDRDKANNSSLEKPSLLQKQNDKTQRTRLGCGRAFTLREYDTLVVTSGGTWNRQPRVRCAGGALLMAVLYMEQTA